MGEAIDNQFFGKPESYKIEFSLTSFVRESPVSRASTAAILQNSYNKAVKINKSIFQPCRSLTKLIIRNCYKINLVLMIFVAMIILTEKN